MTPKLVKIYQLKYLEILIGNKFVFIAVVWFPWLQTKSGDPFILLKLSESEDPQVRRLGVHALSQQHDWEGTVIL